MLCPGPSLETTIVGDEFFFYNIGISKRTFCLKREIEVSLLNSTSWGFKISKTGEPTPNIETLSYYLANIFSKTTSNKRKCTEREEWVLDVSLAPPGLPMSAFAITAQRCSAFIQVRVSRRKPTQSHLLTLIACRAHVNSVDSLDADTPGCRHALEVELPWMLVM